MVCALYQSQCVKLLLQGNNTAAMHLVQAALSNCQPPSPGPSQSRASKSKAKQQQQQHPGKADQTAAHPSVHARALHLQAKLLDSSSGADHVVLTGCDSVIAQRQRSHAEASTSATEQPKPASRGSSARGKAARAVTRGRSTRNRAAAVEESGEQLDSGPCDAANGQQDTIKQAELLLQAYQLSQGYPLLLRSALHQCMICVLNGGKQKRSTQTALLLKLIYVWLMDNSRCCSMTSSTIIVRAAT